MHKECRLKQAAVMALMQGTCQWCFMWGSD